MGGRSGGTRTETANLPAFVETGLQQALGSGKDVAATGYVPYYGPDVASFSPMQNAAFEGTDMMASAFGMPTSGGQSYLPEPTTMGGMTGYSSGPGFDAAVAELANRRPGQAEYIDSFTIDPVTGEPGSRVPANQPVALEMQGQGRKGGK